MMMVMLMITNYWFSSRAGFSWWGRLGSQFTREWAVNASVSRKRIDEY